MRHLTAEFNINHLLLIVRKYDWTNSTASYQHRGRSEEITERIVHQVEEGGGIDVCISCHLASKEGLSRAAAEQAASHTVTRVHIERGLLNG